MKIEELMDKYNKACKNNRCDSLLNKLILLDEADYNELIYEIFNNRMFNYNFELQIFISPDLIIFLKFEGSPKNFGFNIEGQELCTTFSTKVKCHDIENEYIITGYIDFIYNFNSDTLCFTFDDLQSDSENKEILNNILKAIFKNLAYKLDITNDYFLYTNF